MSITTPGGCACNVDSIDGGLVGSRILLSRDPAMLLGDRGAGKTEEQCDQGNIIQQAAKDVAGEPTKVRGEEEDVVQDL